MKYTAGGFTLVELLVVVAIVAILASTLLSGHFVMRQRARLQQGRSEILMLKTALEQYRTDFGDYPPSTLEALSGRPGEGNGINEGNEAMTACLTTSRMNGPYFYPAGPHDRRFRNLDMDSGSRDWTAWVFDDDELREIVDPWDNPYLYFHGRELRDGLSASYQVGTRHVTVRPVRDDETDTFRSALTYQLWSFGLDGVNDEGEGDDLANWTVQEQP